MNRQCQECGGYELDDGTSELCDCEEVQHLGGTTKGDVPARDVLAGAVKAKLKSVVVIGETEDGENYYAMSSGDNAENLWLVESFKHAIMQPGEES